MPVDQDDGPGFWSSLKPDLRVPTMRASVVWESERIQGDWRGTVEVREKETVGEGSVVDPIMGSRSE